MRISSSHIDALRYMTARHAHKVIVVGMMREIVKEYKIRGKGNRKTKQKQLREPYRTNK